MRGPERTFHNVGNQPMSFETGKKRKFSRVVNGFQRLTSQNGATNPSQNAGYAAKS